MGGIARMSNIGTNEPKSQMWIYEVRMGHTPEELTRKRSWPQILVISNATENGLFRESRLRQDYETDPDSCVDEFVNELLERRKLGYTPKFGVHPLAEDFKDVSNKVTEEKTIFFGELRLPLEYHVISTIMHKYISNLWGISPEEEGKPDIEDIGDLHHHPD